MTLAEKIELAKDINTSKDVLMELSKFKNEKIQNAVASNPSTSADILKNLSRGHRKEATILEIISNRPYESVQCSVIKNINCTPEILESLSKYSSSSLKANVALNHNCPIHILEALSKDESEKVRKAVASNENCPNSILEALSKDENHNVREAVASNEKSSPELLEYLSKDSINCVNQAVERNPNAPIEIILKALSEDKGGYLKRTLVKNKSTSIEVLKLLSEDKSDYVREAIANHPKIIEEKKEILEAKVESFKNDSKSLEEFERLAKSPNAEIRANLAKNENCPNSILQILASDLNDNVSFSAIRNKNYIDSSDDDMFDAFAPKAEPEKSSNHHKHK